MKREKETAWEERPEREKRRRGAEGFTLVEIMVVVVIIGMLASLVGISVIRQLEKGKRGAAAAQIHNFMTALDAYYMDNGFYPTTTQGLQALVQIPSGSPAPRNYPQGGYLPKIPLDPWGNEYIYFSPGISGGAYSIESYGADGMDGGDGPGADVESWDLGGD